MSTPPNTLGPPGAVWTTAAVSRHLGVAPETLRSWARRYGIGPAGHSPGRHRRYTGTDVAELESMCALVARGMTLPAAAAVVRGREEPGTSPPNSERTPADAVDDLVAAANRLDLDAATGVVTVCLAAHGVAPTWDRLCRPAMRGLDAAAKADHGCADAHLLLSWAIGSCLRRPRAVASDGSTGRPVLLACAPAEQHTLALDALFAALRERRVPARMLGPAVPSAALRHAVAHLRPAAVVVWSQRDRTARPHLLRHLSPYAGVVLVAGPGWHGTAVPPSVLTADSLTAALAQLTVTSAGEVGSQPSGTGLTVVPVEITARPAK